ncbi:MAG: hypothetical protein GY853_08470 [PVC group bacterium]|nr:hypothetical protein [PVC group bacterium]
MKLEDLPKWTHIFPVLLGVGLSIAGMYLFPKIGIRNTFGPILGLPAGAIIGFIILAVIAKSKK